MRKLSVEVRLKSPGTRPHPPRAVLELSAQEKIDATLISRIARRQLPGVVQREECRPRGPCVTFQTWQLRPTTVGTLTRHELADVGLQLLRRLPRPRQPEELKHRFVMSLWSLPGQPATRSRRDFQLLRVHALVARNREYRG